MIDKIMYGFFGALDKVSEWIDNVFTSKRKKKR